MGKENLRRMVVFAAVAEAESFSGAARRLGITRSAVSRQVALLEQSLAVRLLNRTTRQLSFTEAGEVYYRGCVQVLEAAEAADQSIQGLSSQPTGTVKITVPVIAQVFMIAAIDEFLGLYPRMNVDVTLEDRYVNLVEEGYDLAVRIGHPSDSSLVARRLAPIDKVVVGSRDYFTEHGKPEHPEALAGHRWIIYSLLASPRRFTFVKNGARRSVTVSGRLKINGGPALREALLAGLGLTVIPRFYVAPDLDSGTLEVALSEYEVSPSSLYAVYPHREHLPTKVRAFVELLARRVPASLQ